MAPMAAAISGIRAGKNPPLRPRRFLVLALLLRMPVPLMGVAEAVVPVIRSVAVVGAPVTAAVCAAVVAAGLELVVAERQ